MRPSRRHRQVLGFYASEMAGRGRCWDGVQAAAATPLISAHISNAPALAARYSLAVTWSRRRWKSNCVIRCGFVVCFDEGAAVLGPVNDAAPPSAVAVGHHWPSLRAAACWMAARDGGMI